MLRDQPTVYGEVERGVRAHGGAAHTERCQQYGTESGWTREVASASYRRLGWHRGGSYEDRGCMQHCGAHAAVALPLEPRGPPCARAPKGHHEPWGAKLCRRQESELDALRRGCMSPKEERQPRLSGEEWGAKWAGDWTTAGAICRHRGLHGGGLHYPY